MSTSFRPAPNWQARFETWLEDLRQTGGIPGVAVAVFTDSDVLLRAGYGYRNVEAGLRAEPDTIFGIASITKSFTALAVLRAATGGDLDLDDPVTKWLPEFTLWEGRTPPTVRHFLNQTSGLAPTEFLVHAMAESVKDDPLAAFSPPHPNPRPAATSRDVIDFLNAEAALLDEPGVIFSYQNDAYGLLGEIVTRATGTPYTEYVTRNIVEPLGMTRTGFDLARVLADDNVTTLYATDPAGNVLESPKWQDSPSTVAAGFLRSTADDLTAYVRFLLAGDGAPLGIRDDLLEEMRSPQAWAGASRYGFGLGVTGNWQGYTLITHSGGLKGVSSHMGFVPELGVGVVVLTNLENQPADRIWLAAVSSLLDLDPDTPRYTPEPGPVGDEDLADMAGEYRSGEPWGVVRLLLGEDGSMTAIEGDPPEKFPALAVSRDVIAIEKPGQNRYDFWLRDDSGAIRGLLHGSRVLLKQS